MTSRNDIKRDVFYRLLDLAGRVYVVVRHSDEVMVGRRGFTDQERQNGLVLVFNNNMRFTWDTEGIHASLVFGGVAEKCYIPSRDILAIYSPDAKVQLTVEPRDEESMEEEQPEVSVFEPHEHHRHVHTESDGKIIKVDFHRHNDEIDDESDNGDEPA